MIKYISFDLDGTLADETFDKLIWNEEIPKLYAEKNKLSLEDAKTKVYAEYYKAEYLEKINSWTDIDYWFKRLNLKNYEKLLKDMKKHVFVYKDTIPILEHLSKKYKLIIVSNAEQKFLNMKIESERIKRYFTHIFSAPSTFGLSKKNKEMFQKILKKLRIEPNEIMHVGDDHYLDYEVPTSIGIKAFHLVRSKKVEGENAIKTLLELKKKY